MDCESRSIMLGCTLIHSRSFLLGTIQSLAVIYSCSRECNRVSMQNSVRRVKSIVGYWGFSSWSREQILPR
jgi:hypothetical protein